MPSAGCSTPATPRSSPAARRGDLNLYNVLNSYYANSVNTTFSTTSGNQFLRPTAVILGRLFKIGGQIEF